MPSEKLVSALFILAICVAAGFVPVFLMMGVNFTPALPSELVRTGDFVARLCPVGGFIVGVILAFSMRDRDQ